MNILGIETSCDETACAVVENGVRVVADCVASSADLHMMTGGVVPEVAARKQVEFIVPVMADTLEKSGLSADDIDAIAVTVGPGLIGSLVVGIEAAKALALSWDKPIIGVNHLVGHIYGNFLENPDLTENEDAVFPSVVLIVSGGHTDLVLMRGHGDFEFLGGTLDDAAGEAFDKTARLLGLSKYLGGRELSELAATCDNNVFAGQLPRPLLHEDNFDFSFSGLKTAVRRLVEKNQSPDVVASIAREFEDSVVEVLVAKAIKAAQKHDAQSIMLAGGVAANKFLRQELKVAAEKINTPLFVPPIKLCTDNAVYIASAAFFNNNPQPLEKIRENPSLGVVSD